MEHRDPRDADSKQQELPLEMVPALAASPGERSSQCAAATEASKSFSEPTDQLNVERETRKVRQLLQRIQPARVSGKIPLFVLGAGISAQKVPLLKGIAGWFLNHPNVCDPRLKYLLERLKRGTASRAEAAELFSALQSTPNRGLWSAFSKSFLLGAQPLLELDSQGTQFQGLVKAKPSKAHCYLAEMLGKREAHAFSLNFDGLTVAALKEIAHKAVALHSRQQVRTYFTATGGDFIPAVIKVRGDVFYAMCTQPLCPASNEEFPLDRLHLTASDNTLTCPACGQDSLVLRFSFPGYRVKEEAAYPVLWEARRFLAQSWSAIIVLGLSGRWDRYLLDFLFDLAVERGLPVADVKPPCDEDAVIDSFRLTYYPSCPDAGAPQTTLASEGPAFMRIRLSADEFCAELRNTTFTVFN